MTLSRRTRFEVFKRDGFICRYCGQKPPEVVLHVDHVVARAEGGSDDPANLVTSCASCNLGKSDKPLGATLPQVSELEILEALQDLAERKVLLSKQVAMSDAVRSAEEAAVRVVVAWIEQDMGVVHSPPHAKSIRTFIRELGVEGVRQAVETTAAWIDRRSSTTQDHAWRAFCKICWTWIRQNEEGTDGPEA